MGEPASPEPPDGEPVFGFILVGGPLSGAQLRDLRLANELARRGFRVHVWWAMDRTKEAGLDDSIVEHHLFHAFRYLSRTALGALGRGPMDALGRATTAMFGDRRRGHFLGKRPGLFRRLAHGLLRAVAEGVHGDGRLSRRFGRELEATGVTHVLPMLAVLCPFVEAAAAHMARPPRFVVTFQGYELYLNYARGLGVEQRIHERFKRSVAVSHFPAIAVSEDYKKRVVEDISLDPSRLRAIPPGVETPPAVEDRAGARDRILSSRPGIASRLRADTPIVSFLGRQDTEKGVDLLLYAAAILQRRGRNVQIAIAGPTLFDSSYGDTCQQIAKNLRLRVLWWRGVSDAFRADLFAASRCVVYPSIHREPFGMVPVEAAAQGTPAVVPDWGGVAQTIEDEDKRVAGLRFRAWDSGGLADCIERLIQDNDLWDELSANGPAVAEHFSVPRLADRVLQHLRLRKPSEAPTPSRENG